MRPGRLLILWGSATRCAISSFWTGVIHDDQRTVYASHA
jgi:hypothetical protein